MFVCERKGLGTMLVYGGRYHFMECFWIVVQKSSIMWSKLDHDALLCPTDT